MTRSRRRRSSARPPQLELYDLTPALVSPSVTARLDSAVPYRNLYTLLTAVQAKATTGTPSGYVLFKPVKVTTGTGKKKKTKTVYVIASKNGNDSGTFATLHRDASTGNAGAARRSRRQGPGQAGRC